MKKILLLITLGMMAAQVRAQVGINTQTPDSSAVLHIDGGGTKGLIIPFISPQRRNEIMVGTNPPANGLLAYDEDQKIFYFFNGTEWIALNPLQAADQSENVIKASNGRDTLTLESTLADLDVAGTLKVSGNSTFANPVVVNSTLSTTGSITSGGNISAGNNHISAGSVSVGTNTEITSDKVKTNTLEGYGVIPPGGIIMWSGTDVPDGWALCDGQPSNGYQTPDLRGRFIVGHGANDNGLPANVWDNYTNPGNLSEKGSTAGQTGGEMEHLLILNEMPKHNHTALYSRGVRHSDKGSDYTPISGFSDGIVKQFNTSGTNQEDGDGGKTNLAGDDQPHENRPPYYVLAFIMRVK